KLRRDIVPPLRWDLLLVSVCLHLRSLIMAARLLMGTLGASLAAAAGCASDPFDRRLDSRPWADAAAESAPAQSAPRSVYRAGAEAPESRPLEPDAAAADYIRYALFHSPEVEAAYQRWRAAAERLPQ